MWTDQWGRDRKKEITQLKADLAKAQQKHISGYWACSKCDNIEFSEREVKCCKCGKGEMLYQDKEHLRSFIKQATQALKDKGELKADLTKYKGLYEKNRKFLTTTMKRLDESSWENEQDLKFYLNKFAGHTADCKLTRLDIHGVMVKCDCGFAEAQERWE